MRFVTLKTKKATQTWHMCAKIQRDEMSEPVPTNWNRFGGEHNEIFIGVILTGGPAECGDGRERGRADGGGDQLSEAKRTDDLLARGREHPFSLLTQVKLQRVRPERSSD